MTHSSPIPLRRPLTARGQLTRGKLVAAAEAEFAELGFESASISGIVGRARVAQGTFYVYFPDKKSILIELVDSLGARLREVLADAVEGCKDRLAVERAGLRAFLRFTAKHRGLYRIVPQAEIVDEACYRRYYQTLAAGYVKGLRAAMGRGELRRIDPEVLARCLMGINDMVGLNFVLWHDDVDVERVIDSVMDFVAHGAGPELRAAPTRPVRKRGRR